MFGGFGVVYCSKCGESISRLEGLVWCIAPNVGSLSRVWRVVAGLVLQMWGVCLVFGGFGVVYCSKCGEYVSCLECYCLCRAPNVRDDLPERLKRSARRHFNAETRLSWKSSGLPTRVS